MSCLVFLETQGNGGAHWVARIIFSLFPLSPLSSHPVCLTLSVWLRFFCQCAWIASVHDWKKRRRRLWVVFAEAVTQHLEVCGLYLQWEWLKGYKGRKRDKRSLSEYSSSTTAILRKYRSSHTRWRSWRKTKGWKKNSTFRSSVWKKWPSRYVTHHQN